MELVVLFKYNKLLRDTYLIDVNHERSIQIHRESGASTPRSTPHSSEKRRIVKIFETCLACVLGGGILTNGAVTVHVTNTVTNDVGVGGRSLPPRTFFLLQPLSLKCTEVLKTIDRSTSRSQHYISTPS